MNSPSLHKQLLFCACCAVLLIFSFPWIECWLLAWGAFIPLFFALEGTSARRAFLLSYATGFIFWIGTIYWLVHITAVGLVVLAAYLSFYVGIFGMLVSQTSLKPASALLAVPALWVLLEFLRSYLLTGFGWALLGYSQYRVTLCLQIASLTGVWGVSYLVMTVNVCLYALLRHAFYGVPAGRGRVVFPARSFSVALLAICGACTYGVISGHKPEPETSYATIALIQPNIPQELKWDPRARSYIFRTYARLTEDAARHQPDLIVWPEAAFPGIIGEDQDLYRIMRDFIDRVDIPVLLGAVVSDAQRYYNSAVLIDARGALRQVYDKIHLVPFGEYVPLRNIFPFLQAVAPIGDIEAGREFSLFNVPGEKSLRPLSAGVLICFEDVFPDIAREFVRRGAGALINITNDAWYQESPAAKQHFTASVLRAVENRRWLLRVTNTGVSGAIRPDGSIQSILSAPDGREIFTQGLAVIQVPVGELRQSVYTRFPYGFIAVLALIILAHEAVFIFQAAPCGRPRR